MVGRLGLAAFALVLALATRVTPASAAPAPAPTSLADLQREADRAEVRGDLKVAMQTWQKIGEGLGGAPAADRVLAASKGAEILLLVGDIAGARTWSDAELRIAREAFGTRTGEYGFAELQRAEIERQAGNYDDAWEHSQRARASFVETGRPVPVLLSSVRTRILIDVGNLAAARSEGRAAFDAATEDRPLDLAAAAGARGRVELEAGAYEEARKLLQLAVDYERAVFHRGHPRVGDHLVALAEAQVALGQSAAADRNLRTALLGRRLAWPTDGPPVAEIAVALAASFTAAADDEMARGDLAYASVLLGENVSAGHRLRSKVALRLADLELRAGKLEAARVELVRAAKSLGNARGDPLTVRLLVLRARERRLSGDLDAPAQLLAQAGEIAEAGMRPDVFGEKAAWLAARKDFDASAEAHVLAVESARAAFGPDHERVAAVLHASAKLHLGAGRTADATRLFTEAEAIHERALVERLKWGSDRHKRSFVRSLASATDDIVAFALQSEAKDEVAVELATSVILRRKGRLLDAATADLDVLRRRATEPDRQLLARAQRLRALVASHRLQGPGELDYARYLDELGDAESRLQALDATVSRRTTSFARPRWRVDADNVAAALPDGGVLLEYYRFAAPSGEDRYAVFALAADGSIEAVDLGPAAAIDATAEALRTGLARAGAPFEDAARRGYTQLLQPVAHRFANATAIFVSPDSALNLVPFAALVDESGAFFIDAHGSSYVSSGRDLLAMGERSTPRSGPVVFADPDFGQPRTVGATRAPLTRAKFSALPGTAREAEALSRILDDPKVYARAEATEARLRQVAGPSILHVATHGFFLGAPKDGASKTARALVLDIPEGVPQRLEVDDPLLRSGLAFSGANVHVARDDDGVVTASELLSLDLHGTQLVVLSACETGVGELAAGEGVYGLRRSLVVAGTATQVMSLWKVDDAATRDLMVEFYDRLMTGKIGRADAMRQAQLAVRRERAHPYYWAGFFVSGNPNPLPVEARTGPPGAKGEGCRCTTAPDDGASLLLVLVLALARRRRTTALCRRSRTPRPRSRTPPRT